MRIKRKIMFAVAFVGFGLSLQAQQNQMPQSKTEPIMQIFGNLHTGFGETSSDVGFELERVYLGCSHKLSDDLTIKGVVDVGRSADVSDYHRVAYIKNAMISWKKGNFTFKGGMISTTQFNFQEKFWGHRYVMKSFQDRYKFGSSTDLGLAAYYNPTDWLAMDLIVVNGEGYKKIQSNSGFNYGLGATLTPIKGLQLRLYGGLNQGNGNNGEDVVNLATFIGYKAKNFSIGAEYNHKINSLKTSSYDQSGLSMYMTILLSEKVNLFARYDELSSIDSWYSKDESAAIVGADFTLGKHIKLSPNFRLGMPKAAGMSNNYSAYINCSIGL